MVEQWRQERGEDIRFPKWKQKILLTGYEKLNREKGKVTEVSSLVDIFFLSRLVGKTPQPT